MAVIIICSILTLAYVLLMVAYTMGWHRQKDFVLPASFLPSTFISVIIPARNESSNIAACIEAILAQHYPKELLDVIVVDDHSEDDTAEIVTRYADKNVRCISLADHLAATGKINAYKKAAIALGIANSKGELVVTTDADCMAPSSWLLHMAAIYERQDPVMIVAPVVFSTNNSLLQLFQLTDFMSMQGITGAAHNMKLGNMSNGANLAFSKATYEQVGGYEGIEHLASGDDYLLMMKMNNVAPDRIAYLKSPNAIVTTTPQYTWAGFLQQRIRWASKSGKYNDTRLTSVLLLVYLFNLSFVVLAVAGIFYPVAFGILGIMFAVKVVTEYIFVVPVARFFRRLWVLRYFPFLQPLHILYIVAAGFLGFIGDYQWKGRKVK